jgi:hypothetical protein
MTMVLLRQIPATVYLITIRYPIAFFYFNSSSTPVPFFGINQLRNLFYF